ncbi:Nitroreductase family protein [Methanoculleus thermophilus]|jgi:nitroreductase|uniref:Nitroreductase family protein n=1 Tax=Methanoculleus thermophilus TaxID=2200 RepID=A0A1G8X8D9_9EURY|nr:Nitroreductase family protein [Methanoculleus thermophilus]
MQFVYMETGHAAQNVYLQAETMNLATVAMGAFDDAAVREVLKLSEETVPLYLMPVGRGIPGNV